MEICFLKKTQPISYGLGLANQDEQDVISTSNLSIQVCLPLC